MIGGLNWTFSLGKSPAAEAVHRARSAWHEPAACVLAPFIHRKKGDTGGQSCSLAQRAQRQGAVVAHRSVGYSPRTIKPRRMLGVAVAPIEPAAAGAFRNPLDGDLSAIGQDQPTHQRPPAATSAANHFYKTPYSNITNGHSAFENFKRPPQKALSRGEQERNECDVLKEGLRGPIRCSAECSFPPHQKPPEAPSHVLPCHRPARPANYRARGGCLAPIFAL